MSEIGVGVAMLLCAASGGCALTEVRTRHMSGVEYRHFGESATNADRYTVQQSLELHWDDGVTTGVTFRRRDVDDGAGDNDNGMWFDVSFPIWKAKDNKEAELMRRLDRLEREVAALRQANGGEMVTSSKQ